MYHSTGVIPKPADIHFQIWGKAGSRLRVISFGSPGASVEVHIEDRPTLDTLQGALDLIRADMDYPTGASDQTPTEMADWPEQTADAITLSG